MKTLPADLEALMPEPVGFRSRYRSEPEMIGHYPWTWAGAERRRRKYDRPAVEYEDLYTADQVREAIRGATERAAKLAAPRGVRPCDCDICDCGNSGDLRQVTDWDASAAIAAAIRSGGEGGL